MARRLKVLFLLEDLCYGGTQKQTVALASRLNRNEFDPVILTLTGATDLDSGIHNVPLYHMGASRKVAPLFFARLGAKIRSIKPDILAPCTALPNIWGRIWGRALSVPVVVGTCRGGGAIRRQHEFLLSRFAHGIVCNSRELEQKLLRRGYSPARLRYIPNGVDTEYFQPRSPGRNQRIICLARLAQDKDHKTLIKAFAIVAEKFPEAVLQLVGEGPEETTLKTYVAHTLAADVARRVEFSGASADPAPLLQKADILALSSVREAQPNAILEAMACGLPVCASNVGSIPEMIENAGLLNSPGDAAGLAANLCQLLENPQQARHLGHTGRTRVERNFSFVQMVSRHEDFFRWLWQQQTMEQA